MLAQNSKQIDTALYQQFVAGLAGLDRNTRDLQESVMSIRMIPMSTVFSRFPHMLRDLAAKLGKQVEFVTKDEATELDKGLVEKITNPLTHLVRNSCDHGIEIPVERLANGKPEHSTITLAASHQGGSILIEVRDDGKGLSRDKLVKKARERGIEAPDSMTDAEVESLIFAPGFSTADVVTDVSGHGVGMDVVKKNITALGGTVEIDSAEGYGISVKVRLPLTLAIMDGMSVGVGDEVYILPLSSVIESFQVQADNIKTIGGSGRVIEVRAEFMQVLDSEQVFGVPRVDFESAGGIMVVAEAEGGRVALRVDQLLGQKGGGEEPGVQLPPRARHLGRHDRGRRPRRAHPRCRQPGASLTPLNPHRSIRNLIPRFAATTMNLNNLRIGPRLAIGFGTVLLLLVAIVAIACLQLARTANGLTGLDHSDERAAIARLGRQDAAQHRPCDRDRQGERPAGRGEFLRSAGQTDLGRDRRTAEVAGTPDRHRQEQSVDGRGGRESQDLRGTSRGAVRARQAGRRAGRRGPAQRRGAAGLRGVSRVDAGCAAPGGRCDT